MNHSMPNTAGFPGFSVRSIPPRRMVPWLKRLFVVALILLMQGPAMLVQEVAWAKMLASYTQERGWKRGVVETFDGNHPCELCRKASRIRDDDEKKDPMERQNELMRFRYSWAEMVAATLMILPVVPEREMVALEAQWIAHGNGRGADAPVSPPPKRV
jgi:hypothetical protein